MKKTAKILCAVLSVVLLLGFGIHGALLVLGQKNPAWGIADEAYRSFFRKKPSYYAVRDAFGRILDRQR